MSLKQEIIESCGICKGSGWYDGEACQCLLRFRTYNRLINAGFSRYSLSFVDREEYQIPFIDHGEEFLNFFLENPEYVEERGLGLYIYSQDKGRGKTTLAHKLAFDIASKFVTKDSYSTRRTYAFQNVEELLSSFKHDKDWAWKSTWYVLDDLGNEDRNTEWKKGLFLSSLQRVFHYRRDKRLPTIVTSNYRPEDLSVIYGRNLDSLLEIHVDGSIGGSLYRGVQVGGAEDLRLASDMTEWPV